MDWRKLRHPRLVPRSLRGRFLLLVIAGSMLPLTLLSIWLANGTWRSGERLLRERLDAVLVRATTEVGAAWLSRRAELLAWAESPAVIARLAAGPGEPDPGAGVAVPRAAVGALGTSIIELVVHDTVHDRAWALAPVSDTVAQWAAPRDAERRGHGIAIQLPVWRKGESIAIGTLEALLAPSTLSPSSTRSSAAGVVIGVLDRRSGATLASLPFDPALLAAPEFTWAGERWLVRRQLLQEPPLVLVAATPAASYTGTFAQAARRGSMALVLVVASILIVTTLMVGRLTRSLERLAAAADAVSRGELDSRIEDREPAEVGRVARAFNAMTESLQRMLAELARQEAQAAVGGFAAALAHEVRNPLTSIRIDLQRIEEQLSADDALRTPLARALREVARLDGTVANALHAARAGAPAGDAVPIRLPLEHAMQAAAPAFDAVGAILVPTITGAAGTVVRGDAGALEQLFLNLLLNAAHALEPGGTASVHVSDEDARIEVLIRDSGCGLPEGDPERAFEPFFSTRVEGTGLGLAIARQIARAHGGELDFVAGSAPGTTVRLRLPRGAQERGVAAGV
jgi:signal transduction histidine kinase